MFSPTCGFAAFNTAGLTLCSLASAVIVVGCSTVTVFPPALSGLRLRAAFCVDALDVDAVDPDDDVDGELDPPPDDDDGCDCDNPLLGDDGRGGGGGRRFASCASSKLINPSRSKAPPKNSFERFLPIA